MIGGCTNVKPTIPFGDILYMHGLRNEKYVDTGLRFPLSTLPGTPTVYRKDGSELAGITALTANYPDVAFTVEFETISEDSLRGAEGWEADFNVYENGLLKGNYSTIRGANRKVQSLVQQEADDLMRNYGGTPPGTVFPSPWAP